MSVDSPAEIRVSPRFLQVAELESALSQCGALDSHRHRFLRAWLLNRPFSAGRSVPERFYPRPICEQGPEWLAALHDLVSPVSNHPGEDGSERWLYALHDGLTVESVWLPREGVCVSTQVGCAVGCRFCMTGQEGLLRQLGSAEIVAQVVRARQARPVRKVVFMGMGEPAHNLEAVLEAIQALGTHGGLAHKQLVFSTVGDPRAFEALPRQRVKPALALSLHTTRHGLRRELLPRAPDLSPQALVDEAERYARATGYPVQVQWTLLEGVNDSDDEMDALATLLQGHLAMVNLIPFNAVEGSGFQRPSWERAADLARQLNRRGVLTRLRRSAGQDVDGGCGQLRARQAAAPEVRISADSVRRSRLEHRQHRQHHATQEAVEHQGGAVAPVLNGPPLPLG